MAKRRLWSAWAPGSEVTRGGLGRGVWQEFGYRKPRFEGATPTQNRGFSKIFHSADEGE